jgi:hypothetical protein
MFILLFNFSKVHLKEISLIHPFAIIKSSKNKFIIFGIINTAETLIM